MKSAKTGMLLQEALTTRSGGDSIMNDHSMLKTGAVETEEITPDILSLRTVMVNVQMIGTPGTGDWVLIDTGLGNFEGSIVEEAEKRFGKPPVCIVLTHGHFDHVGNVKALADRWSVPVYAHPSELAFLTGKEDYPPGDPSVGGGLMARVAPMYPNKAIDLGSRIQPLPEDGSVPGLPEFKWLPTPGHSPGHISVPRTGPSPRSGRRCDYGEARVGASRHRAGEGAAWSADVFYAGLGSRAGIGSPPGKPESRGSDHGTRGFDAG